MAVAVAVVAKPNISRLSAVVSLLGFVFVKVYVLPSPTFFALFLGKSNTQKERFFVGT